MICFLTSYAAFSQDTASDTLQVNLDEIRVEAAHSSITIGKAPMSLSTLNRNITDLASRPASTLDELTYTLPGIWVSNRENAALGERMTIRGMGWRSQFGVRGVQVILDDIPLTVADGQSVMNMVDPAMIQSIELLRGPSATFWGNSSGGVLYMKTQPGPDAPTFTYRGYLGSFNTLKQELKWNSQAGGVRWNAYGSYYQSDGFRDYSASQLIRAGLSAGFDLNSSSTIEARVAYAGMPKAEHPGSLAAEDAENEPQMAWPFNVASRAGKEYHQLMASGQYRKEFDGGFLRVLAHGTYRDLINPLPGPYITVNRLAGGARTTYDFLDLPFDLQIGAEYNLQFDEREQQNNQEGHPAGELIINQNDHVSSHGVFAKAVTYFNKLSVSACVRGDRMVFSADDFIENNKSRRTFTTVNPSVGIHYELPGNTHLFASFSTSFESPTTTEFKNRLGADGNILPGFNPGLNPERAVGIEAGLRGNISSLRLDYDFTGFLQNVRNQIIQETEIDGQAIFSNGGNARHTGFESRIYVTPSKYVSATFMYTYILAEFTGGTFDAGERFTGNRLPGVAPNRFGSNLNLHAGSHTFSADIEHVSSYYADSANSAANPAYTLVNGRWAFNSIQIQGAQLIPFFSVKNIFDERYNTSVAINNNFGRFYEPGSGRSFQAGASLNF